MYLFLSIILFLLITYEKNSKVDSFIDNKTATYTRAYNILYSEYKRMSTLIYMGHINTKDVKNIFKYATQGTESQKNKARTELFTHLKNTYGIIKNFHIKQLHFHLPNNDSFLRFHRPNKFGDNLTDVRATVNYVNTNQKYIDGFEEGRIYNGYRFVFPINEDGIHLGSVEISYSTLRLSQDFKNNYNINSIFLMHKDVVDEKVFQSEKSNYRVCALKDFYIENNKGINELNLEGLTPAALNILDTKLQSSESFSYFDANSKRLFTFIKIKNPISQNVVASFMIESKTLYIQNKTLNYYAFLLISNLLLLFLLLHLYKKAQHLALSNKHTQEILFLNKELSAINNNLEDRVKREVQANKQKEEELIRHSRLVQMGELISIIAHQWKQPLNAISMSIANVKVKSGLNYFNLPIIKEVQEYETFIDEESKAIQLNVNNLSLIIDDFRNFYSPNKKKSNSTLEGISNNQ